PCAAPPASSGATVIGASPTGCAPSTGPAGTQWSASGRWRKRCAAPAASATPSSRPKPTRVLSRVHADRADASRVADLGADPGRSRDRWLNPRPAGRLGSDPNGGEEGAHVVDEQ